MRDPTFIEAPDEARVASQHLAWYKLPETQDFFNFLSQEKQKLIDSAISKACMSDPNHTEIIRCLVSAKQIERTLLYGRTNRESDYTRGIREL